MIAMWSLLRGMGLLIDPGTWVEAGRLLGCAYPRREAALVALSRRGISVLVNLHGRAHDSARLARHGMVEIHLPTADFAAPTPEQLERGIAAITGALASGACVGVHCGGGLGRTGTLLACYLVHQGWGPDAAIGRVRQLRPGSIETRRQLTAIRAYARGRTADA